MALVLSLEHNLSSQLSQTLHLTMKFALPYALAATVVAPYGVAAWGEMTHETIG